ncbi:hypothetical protein [Rubritepida flocculans]|uniref:hypothetical protein n=1 Tax=Rubritepida flocculans TaxID=182403 RepID=UPI00041B5312|nr:hypothetical protein [Rubritepida flocculans]
MRPLLALPLLIAACAADPVADYLGGVGDPVRGAALYGPRNLGDTSAYAGDPRGAAIAAAQLEFLARSFRSDPRWAPGTDPAALTALEEGRREMRAALGIAPDAPGEAVERALRAAAEGLEAGSPVRAEAALNLPELFPLGPRETLRRLGSLPRLPAVAVAGGAAAAELSRRDIRRN